MPADRMLWTQIDHVTITVHSHEPVPTQTWNEYVAWCIERKREFEAGQKDLRSLIYTDGGAPSAGQRALYAEAVGEAPIPVAICSASKTMRGVATAISWFTKQRFGVFPLEELAAALDFLQIEEGERRRAIRETTLRLYSRVTSRA